MQGLRFGFGARLPMLQQAETAECGLACLAMISCFHGRWVEVQTLRQQLQASAKGMNLKQLMEHATAQGFSTRAVRLELEDLPQLQLPCILHWDMNHFVVLRRVSGRELLIHDPAQGVRRLGLAEASRHFTGVALELAPMPDFQRSEPKPAVSLGQLVGQVRGLRRSVLQVLMLSLALEILAVVSPFFQQWVLDGVIVQHDTDLLQVLAIGFGMLMLLQLAISTLRSWMVIYFSTQLNLQWAAGVLSKLLRLPMDYFMRRHLGDVISRFGAIQNIRQTLTSAALNAVLDGLMAGVALVMMLVYSLKLAAVTLLALAAYVLIRVLSYEPFRQANEEQIVHAARQDGHLLESVRGVQSLKLFNREDERLAHWLNLLVNTSNRELATQRLSTLYQSANTLVFGAENIAVVYLGALLVIQGELSIGMSFAYAAYKTQFSGRISALVDLGFQVRMLRIQRERLADIVLSEPEPAGGTGLPSDAVPDIELRQVRFRYAANEPWVLDGVNLRVEAGESVAIVGPSGCGKTTLLKLMLGLLQPTEGEILVMGRPLGAVGLRAWRECLGAVMQEDQLFAGTIAENIAFGDPELDLARVQLCARQAAVEEDVLAMPMGWQTLIGDMGAAISGGQKQRLLLARALYKQPRVLFLDEATSHLDAQRELQVNEAIQALRLTRVVIAHRQETIERAGRVIRLAAVAAPALR